MNYLEHVICQRAHSHADYFEISVDVFNGSLCGPNKLLNVLCHYMFLPVCEFSANIYTFIFHGLGQASKIHIVLMYGLSSQVLLFQSHTSTTSIIAI